MANTFDSKINYIEDDIKKIQVKTNLYVQTYGDAGVFHLFKEVAQNCIDEEEDPACIGFLKSIKESTKKLPILIRYDRLADRVTIEDNGRGIPEDDYSVEIVCTKNQSGSKFFRDQGGVSSGEFGVGLTVVNALSSEFTIATYRGKYYHKISFKDGVKVSDEKGNTKGKKHGTIISFVSNPLYLGAGSHLPLDMCIDWLEMMSYQVSDHVSFEVEEYNGLELLRKMKVTKKPFSDLIYKFIPDDAAISFGPVSFQGNGSIDETITRNVLSAKTGKVSEKTETKTKTIKLEFAFAYDLNMLEYDYDAFCNFTKTDEGGVHVDAVEDVLCKYIQTKAMDSMTDNQKEQYPVLYQDVRSGLKLVVNLSTNAQVQFMGNAKNKIQNTALLPVLKSIARDQIEEYFSSNSGKLQEVIKIVRSNAKTRIDLQKMRSIAVKGRSTRFDDLLVPNFIPCNNSRANQYKEIFLIEGKKSAGGSMSDGRDVNTQAIYSFRGQTLNPYKTTFTKFMENIEWRDYIKVLRCGIGSSFDISKLYYDKILIGTDADIDGHGIAIGISGTHALYLPGIISAGRLYRVYPPLYKIANKEDPFIRDKRELVDIYQKKVVSRYKVAIGDKLNTDRLWAFLYDIVDYKFILSEILQPFYKIPVQLIEAIAASLVICGGVDTRGNEPVLKPGVLNDSKFVRDFMQLLQKRFPEVKLSGSTIKGVANGITSSMEINDRFVGKIEDLIPVYEKYGYIISVRDKGAEPLIMSILDFCDMTHGLTPAIIGRFKGLGECNPEDLWETVLNPANRIAVQLTFGSIERDMEVFRKLKSNKPVYMRQRAEMVDKYRVRYDDLDN